MRIFTGTCSTECATRHKQKPEYPGNWHNFMTSYRFGLDVGANSLGWCVLALREQASRFQSTRPRRGATYSIRMDWGTERFQSTRPRRGATLGFCIHLCVIRVSIHAPPKGRDGSGPLADRGRRRFNPRAPEGARPDAREKQRADETVSIHAPPKGRDLLCAALTGCGQCVSIHAPPKGRDVSLQGITGGWSCFNPRAPEGARRNNGCYTHGAKPVSIHAPPKGRDSVSSGFSTIHTCFNPRAPEGARPIHWSGRVRKPGFQSTRPRRGATQSVLDSAPSTHVSIHAPPKGRDSTRTQDTTELNRFNPRAPEGARHHGQAALHPG